MAAAFSNEHSEEKIGKSLIENGDCTFLDQHKYKRRKVFAVRDFPESCGPFASGVDPVLWLDITGFGSANDAIVEDKSGKHLGGDTVSTKHDNDPQHSEFNKDLFHTETLRQASDTSLKKENLVVSSHQVNGPTLAIVEPAEVASAGMEISDAEGSSVQKRNPIVSSPPVNAPILADDEPAKVVLAGMETLDMEVATEDPMDSSVKKENLVVSSHQVNGPTLAIVEPAEVALAGLEIPDAEGSSLQKKNPMVSPPPVNAPILADDEPVKMVLAGMETLDMEVATEDPMKKQDSYILKSSSPAGEVAIPDDSESSSPNINIAGTGACMVNAVTRTRMYPPRRKLSAVRDFPHLCGRNAPRLNQDECLKGISSFNNKRVGQQSLAVFESPLKKVAATDVKQVENNRDTIQVEGICLEAKPLAMSSEQALKGHLNKLEVSSDRKVVVGLMSQSECPWRSDGGSSKFKSVGSANESQKKKVDYFAQLDRSKTAVKTKVAPKHVGQKLLKKKKENYSSDDEKKDQLVMWKRKDSVDPDENNEDFQSVPKSHGLDVVAPPFGDRNLSSHKIDSDMTRNKVRKALRLFQAVSRKLLHEVEAKSNERPSKRIDLLAANILKEKGNYVNKGKQILGPVPGVEVGDEFQYRVELSIIGLHRQIQGGIDYVKHNGKILATSIVASGGYADELDNSDVLIYSGQGGNVVNTDKEPEDQKLVRGNLALKNSCEEQNPVRVIRGTESIDGKSKTYVYDGFYLVESYWQDMGPHGKLVYKFRLRRIPGQPELALKEVKKSKRFKTREGLCVADISYGKERIPICAVNTIDDEMPPPFKYITKLIYPDCCNLIPPEGCDCINGCSDLEKCSCVLKNGGEIPFNHNGAIIEAKPLVFECGPNCNCPPTCHNRVSQLGIKFQLEIFKTNSRGWGVRSLNSIPSGSFICEYIGEVLEDKEAEQRTGNDEYLFDIGNNNSNSTLWDGLSTLMPDSQSRSCEVVKDVGFTIDAAQFANLARFFNHSCSPNLYAQNVLYDHHDNRIPHIMLFAAENIPPLQELTYDYNYMIDQVHDSDGNIKRKDCYCGSVECTGRLY